MNARLGIPFAVLALAAGCQSGSSASRGVAGTASSNVAAAPPGAAPFSGFLGDYSQLKPDPGREGVLVFIDRSADYRPYTKVMFDPVQMLVAPSAEAPGLAPEEQARMSAELLSSFKQALAPAYQVVMQPGPDVLRIRTAITGIQAVKPPAGASDYLPVVALFNLGREAAGAASRVPEMAAETEILDPGGKRVAAATATRKGEAALPQGAQLTWNELQAITDYWAKGLRQRLDELRSARLQ